MPNWLAPFFSSTFGVNLGPLASLDDATFRLEPDSRWPADRRGRADLARLTISLLAGKVARRYLDRPRELSVLFPRHDMHFAQPGPVRNHVGDQIFLAVNGESDWH